MSLKLMYITNAPKVAAIAQKYGVDRIFIDLETLGKEERQKGMNTVKSNHTVLDVLSLRKIITQSEILVRVNPWNKESPKEIDDVVKAGADVIMLPMWKTADEVRSFVRAVDGRAKTMLLLETKEADECLDEVLSLGGVDEIHIGLNDLHLSYGLTFMFELLANGTIERICAKIRARGIPYGFGGVARIGAGDLPAERILSEHYRLGSSFAILSRSFCNTDLVQDMGEVEKIFDEKLKELRAFEKSLETRTEEEFEENKKQLCEIVERIVERKKNG
ncbi:MAG: aldolase [Clostridiales bacterium]|nr:aldolase [Clostridiales bacterium]